MKYFLDTEFHEYKKKPLFGKPIDTIELISIGIISEEYKYAEAVSGVSPFDTKDVYKQKEYYAICKDFDLKAAWNNEWLRENVLIPIYKELLLIDKNVVYKTLYKEIKRLINKYGKTKKQIAEEILEFVYPKLYNTTDNYGKPCYELKPGYWVDTNIMNPEFYAYYADYDWVVFCWLFGRMIDLPKEFPMYCRDLQQTKDEKWDQLIPNKIQPLYRNIGDGIFQNIHDHPNYPKQSNEHNALADAKWNYELYKFLNTL